jgi:RNA polymerase sigma factor (TIGR02999 family)
MRRILVDYARARNAEKRGGGAVISIEGIQAGAAKGQNWDEILAVDKGLERLAQFDSRKARVVELRFFSGLEIDEIAALLNLSSKTIKRDLQFAQAWLYAEMFPNEKIPKPVSSPVSSSRLSK